MLRFVTRLYPISLDKKAIGILAVLDTVTGACRGLSQLFSIYKREQEKQQLYSSLHLCLCHVTGKESGQEQD